MGSSKPTAAGQGPTERAQCSGIGAAITCTVDGATYRDGRLVMRSMQAQVLASRLVADVLPAVCHSFTDGEATLERCLSVELE